MADAERDELKTLIRETIREMAKETAEIWWNSPINPPTSIGGTDCQAVESDVQCSCWRSNRRLE